MAESTANIDKTTTIEIAFFNEFPLLYLTARHPQICCL